MAQSKPRVLLVDDDASMLSSLRRNLVFDYDVTTCEDPRQALEIIENNDPFAVIVSDYKMPFLDGIEFFEQVKELQPHSMRIMLTGHADLGMAVEAVNRGNIFRFLLKPSQVDLLRATVAEAMSHHSEMEHLHRTSTTDALTGLLNRGTIMQRLQEELQRTHRYGHPLSIVLFDLDHFKQVNDTWGHLLGDEVLRRASYALLECSRETDLCGRYGGEEFLFVLPDTGLEQARVYAERIRAEIEKLAFAERDLHVTISGGVVQCNGEDAAELIRKADLLLYRAKDNGRNRIEAP